MVEKDFNKQDCKICGKPTNTVYNIRMKAVPICDFCGLAITKQEVSSWELVKKE